MTDPLWTPSHDRAANSNMQRFIHFVQKSYAAGVRDYTSLYAWSIAAPNDFWSAVWTFCDVKASEPWDSVYLPGREMYSGRWFAGAKLNFAENLLRHCTRYANKDALVFWGEDRVRMRVTYAELLRNVTDLAAALRRAGVGVGDRVAGFMPNRPEAVTAMLATASLGAIWTSCSPDFGVQGVLDRFGQIRPKVLFGADGYYYKGKVVDSLVTVGRMMAALPDLVRTIIVPYVGTNRSMYPDGAQSYAEFIALGEPGPLTFAALDFDHPLYILYSSGTTGIPKCIVHGAGSTLLQHLKEHVLHTDLKPDDRLFYFTTCGWMMWNWLVSGLATGATLVLYDGNPLHPSPAMLLDLAQDEHITIFGTSAKYLASIEKAGVTPSRTHDLRALRTILSTGSPLLPPSYDYVYRAWKQDVLLASISGGTDIVSCFALGNPLLPVYRGELQCRGLGMKVEVFDEQGRSVRGRKGELVCTAPFPSMPVGFWGDTHHSKYRDAYFAKFPGIWAHGDFAELTERDGVLIYGRSDAVLNPGGVRIGTAEIYRRVETLPEIVESIAVAQEWQGDQRIILFVKLGEGIQLNEELRERIRSVIRAHTTPRHVPAKILQVSDIPRTMNGKIVELAVTHVIHDRPVVNRDAIVNPQVLEEFRGRAELRSE